MIIHDFNVTTTWNKIREMTKKIKVIQGGQAAGKNYAIAQILFHKALNEKCLITVMTDTYDNLKDGSIKDFENIFNDCGLNFDEHYNKSDKEIKIRDGLIQFRYISDTRKNTGKSKRRDYLYINEGNKIGWEVASTYIGRTHKDVYIDHNPDYEYWAHTEVPKLKDDEGNQLSEQIIVTYQDNEYCPEGERQYILSRKDNQQWFRIYGLGLTGTYSDRQVYNFEIIDSIPPNAKKINSGMDFGCSPDPTVLVDLYIDGPNLYVDEVFCENNLMPEKIKGAERLSVVDQMNILNYPKNQLIVGDTSGKVSIIDMRKHGYNIAAVRKNTPVIDGISKVLSYNLYATKRSVNIIKGMRSWFRKVDHNRKIIQEPEAHEPDGLAAIRYGIMFYYQ
jgi:phage terminase large subunit